MNPRAASSSISLRRYGASPGSHSHAHFQVLMGLSGTLELEVEGRGLRVASGSGCIIEPGARHDFESRHGSVCLVIDSADGAWAQCALPPAPAITLAHYLATALQQGLPLAQAQGPALLLEAWRAHSAIAGAPGATSSSPPTRRRTIDWTRLQAWATQHADTPLTVADLAGRVHLSPSQFAARCRDDLGISAMAWLRGHRLAQARLLRDSGMAVAEVARRTGYRSPSALTAALRRGASLPSSRHCD